ncbi:zinc finger protein 432 [Myxocyprinus asiaticus]|uniref:zinc finger protein 432 n=1 Tax=Myxocyprinus asiaticus TaxID=70543 RepID=UPI0022233D10|nr:zinc finger protein 432 [Myxocyprinus asiaticus]
MLHKCVVGGCPNRSDTIIHYILPEDPKRRSLWLKFIEDSKADGENASSSCRVCGDHFSEENYFKLDLGCTTRMILSVDAVPTIVSVNRSSLTENKNQNEEAEDENVVGDKYKITIGETISLAGVKEEPLEYDLSANMAAKKEEQNLSLDKCCDYEEIELALTDEMDVHMDSSTKPVVQDIGGKAVKFISCSTCGKKFRRRRNLMKHRRAEHPKKTFLTKSEVKEKIFVCSCGEKFHTMPLLLQHRATHSNDGKYSCHHCGKGFPGKVLLTAHQKIHKDTDSLLPYLCDSCPRRFGYKVALIAHLKNHSAKHTCTCPICEEGFQLRGSLAHHLKIYHAGKRLTCKTCDKTFLVVNDYFKHIDSHVVVTPYYCAICQIYLTQRSYVPHMQTHEKMERESVEYKPKRGRKGCVSVSTQQKNSEEGTTLGMEPVVQDEAGMEPLSESEMDTLAESSASAVESTVEAVASGEAQIVLEEEMDTRGNDACTQ